MQDLGGAPVATDRGAGYVPRPAEPEPQLVFVEFAVAGLAGPHPFREPACMLAGPCRHRALGRTPLPPLPPSLAPRSGPAPVIAEPGAVAGGGRPPRLHASAGRRFVACIHLRSPHALLWWG